MQNFSSKRIASIDILRGLIMIIMALDHVRDFFHAGAVTGDPLDLKTTTPILFFTRWITHYCAPTFVFLSGVSAWLASKRKVNSEAGFFLMKRGLWLVFVEVVIINFAFTFNPHYNFIILQVIWVIGLSMVLLGLLILISKKLILPVGLLLVFGHNIFDYIKLAEGAASTQIIRAIIAGPFVQPFGPTLSVAFFYTLLPWTGLMFTGFGIGYWFADFTVEKRRKWLVTSGIIAIVLFVVIRGINLYGNPSPWAEQGSTFYTFLSFINTSKYPPSLDYSLMTIGPALLLLVLFERSQNRLTNIFAVYGKVPFFYYVCHFYLIHICTVIGFYISGYGSADIVPKSSPFLFRPDSFGYSLPVVYLIWLSIVASLYFPCKWFIGVKQRNREKWWVHYV